MVRARRWGRDGALNARVRRLDVPEWALVTACNRGSRSRRTGNDNNGSRTCSIHDGYEPFYATGRSPGGIWAELGILAVGIS